LNVKRVSLGRLHTIVRSLDIFTDLFQEIANMDLLILSICFELANSISRHAHPVNKL